MLSIWLSAWKIAAVWSGLLAAAIAAARSSDALPAATAARSLAAAALSDACAARFDADPDHYADEAFGRPGTAVPSDE